LLSAIWKRSAGLSAILIVIPLYDMLVQTGWELVFSTGFFMRIRTDNSGRDSGYLCWYELRQNGDNYERGSSGWIGLRGIAPGG
jgi:hypothetical protein